MTEIPEGEGDEDRLILENRPDFSVWAPELGHFPYVNLRFERQQADSNAADFIITTGGGFPTEPLEIADFLEETAETLRTAHAKNSAEDPGWDEIIGMFDED